MTPDTVESPPSPAPDGAPRNRLSATLRQSETVTAPELFLAMLLVLAIPSITAIGATIAVALALVALILVIAYETRVYGESRRRVRHAAYDPQAG